MALTAKTSSGVKVIAPELTEKRQEFFCRFCDQPMIFVDAELKTKHFRHKTEALCDFESETEEHERYKLLVYHELKNRRIGEAFLEHRIGKTIADIYLRRKSGPDIAFKIQATNYDVQIYEENIIKYAFRKLLVIYIFVGDNFCKEIKQNIYSLKEIEKRIINQKAYRDTVIGCYLENENVTIPSFKEKHAKGRSGYNTHRFIINYNEIRKMLLNHYLDYILEYYIKERYQPQCNHKESAYEKSNGKISRYKEICSDCGKFIKWLSNKEAAANGLIL